MLFRIVTVWFKYYFLKLKYLIIFTSIFVNYLSFSYDFYTNLSPPFFQIECESKHYKGYERTLRLMGLVKDSNAYEIIETCPPVWRQ